MNNTKRELRLKNTLDCLKDMYETSKKNGSFECMSDYQKTYTASIYLGLALLQEKIVKKIGNGRSTSYEWIATNAPNEGKIVKKIGNGRSTSYEWIATNAPNEGMVERIFQRISIIGRNYSKKSGIEIPVADTLPAEENHLSSAFKGNVTVNADDWFDAYKMLSSGKYSEKDRRELAKEFAKWKVGLKTFV